MSRPLLRSCVGWAFGISSLAALQAATTTDATGQAPGESVIDLAPAPTATPRPLEPDGPNPASDSTIGRTDPPLEAPRLPARASYTLNVRLDPLEHQLSARGSIRFENRTAHRLDELYLHLYLNAFARRQTLWARDPFTTGRDGRFPARPGHVAVERFVDTRTGFDLWPTRAPGDASESHDETDVRLPLEVPIEPGESVEFTVQWRAQLPSLVQRTGFAGDYHFVGQWFPKLAKLRRDGSWAHFSFHPQAEFHADFGRYDVTLEVPRHFVVGATGQRLEETETTSGKQVRYVADQVHDFAWTAWPRYQERVDQVGDVQVRLLYPPSHEHNAALTLETLRFALPFFQSRFGRYPYPSLTVVHPPRQAAASGGMEYPTLITTGGSWLSPWLSRQVQLVTLHELAHQWFYAVVASDEASFPFLDEGLTSYAEGLASQALFGDADASNVLGLQLSARAFQRAAAASDGLDFVIAQPARQFPSFQELANLAYARTATLYRTLDNVYDSGFQAALSHYAREHRFGHAGPEELLAAIEASLGHEVRETARRALFERGWVDYRIERIRTRPTPAPELDEAGRGASVARASSASTTSRILVVRRGDLSFPVQILLVDDTGRRFRQEWDGRGSHVTLHHTGHPIVSAVVDPEHRVSLDLNLLNNATSTEARGGLRVASWLTWTAQLLLHWIES